MRSVVKRKNNETGPLKELLRWYQMISPNPDRRAEYGALQYQPSETGIDVLDSKLYYVIHHHMIYKMQLIIILEVTGKDTACIPERP